MAITVTSPTSRSAPRPPALRGGAVVLGNAGDGGLTCFFTSPYGATLDVEDPAGNSYTAPFNGIITSYSTFANGTAGQVRALILGPSATAGHKTLAAKSELRTVTPSILNTFPARITVQTGQRLSLGLSATGMSCASSHAGSTDVMRVGESFDADTSTDFVYSATPFNSVRPSISAVLEPDLDHDGFGDVSQDSCPQSAATQDVCPAPDTLITKKPKARSHKRQATIGFSSPSGTTFTCAVDGAAPATCVSPFRATFTYGKHTVLITAVSALGIADQTPASVVFKIVRRHR